MSKAFLLSCDRRFIDAAKRILGRLDEIGPIDGIGDPTRIRIAADMFIRQAEAGCIIAP